MYIYQSAIQVMAPGKVVGGHVGADHVVFAGVGTYHCTLPRRVHLRSCLIAEESEVYISSSTHIPILLFKQFNFLLPPELAGGASSLFYAPLHSSNRVQPSIVLVVLWRRCLT